MGDVIDLKAKLAERIEADGVDAYERGEAFRFVELEGDDVETVGTIDGGMVVFMFAGLDGLAMAPDVADKLADALREAAAFARTEVADGR